MRILIDIGHPAHVHYFRNFYKLMKKNHAIQFVAREKEVTFELLNHYGIKFINRGIGGSTLITKLVTVFSTTSLVYKTARKFYPDLLISFASPYTALVSKLIKKPHIAFTDTEHAKLGKLGFIPFSTYVITPSSYNEEIPNKHIRFDGYMELSYLHPKYFEPSDNIFELLGVNAQEKYFILRFVSWNASHDIGQKGLDNETKINLVRELSSWGRVFISSESKLPDELQKFRINIPPQKMHDVLSFATLYIGEGATMASECAILGIPAIYVNSLELGYLKEQEEKYGLVYGFRNSKGIIKKAIQLLQNSKLKQDHKMRRKKMLADKIDVTSFMVWFVENYPKSVKIMKANPDYQYNFR